MMYDAQILADRNAYIDNIWRERNFMLHQHSCQIDAKVFKLRVDSVRLKFLVSMDCVHNLIEDKLWLHNH